MSLYELKLSALQVMTQVQNTLRATTKQSWLHKY